ncbi:MAG: hypothetical protein HYZ53_03845 [Planctomycetes bacterium]|nr:hypothetical protein [Planctomycetota bacterium]
MERMKRVVRVFDDFAAADAADLDDWLALSGEERMRIGEGMRMEAFGVVEPGLQRVLRVVELGES